MTPTTERVRKWMEKGKKERKYGIIDFIEEWMQQTRRKWVKTNKIAY